MSDVVDASEFHGGDVKVQDLQRKGPTMSVHGSSIPRSHSGVVVGEKSLWLQVFVDSSGPDIHLDLTV